MLHLGVKGDPSWLSCPTVVKLTRQGPPSIKLQPVMWRQPLTPLYYVSLSLALTLPQRFSRHKTSDSLLLLLLAGFTYGAGWVPTWQVGQWIYYKVEETLSGLILTRITPRGLREMGELPHGSAAAAPPPRNAPLIQRCRPFGHGVRAWLLMYGAAFGAAPPAWPPEALAWPSLFRVESRACPAKCQKEKKGWALPPVPISHPFIS